MKRLPCVIIFLLSVQLSLCCWSCNQSWGSDREVIRIYTSKNIANEIDSLGRSFAAGRDGLHLVVVGGTPDTVIQHFLNSEADLLIIPRDGSDQAPSSSNSAFQICSTPIFSYPVVIVVNPDLPVAEISVQELRDVFSGKYKNWKELSGPDLPIVVIAREQSAGTTVFLGQNLLKGLAFRLDALTISYDKDLLAAVAEKKGAIGFVKELGANRKMVKVLAVKNETAGPAVQPIETSVKDVSYPLTMEIAAYWNCKSPRAALFKEFTESSAKHDWTTR